MFTLPPLPLPAIPAPFPIMSLIINWGIGIILLAMFVRAICSWFMLDERFAFIRFLARLTDPFIVPWRRIIRNIGPLDISFILAIFGLSTLRILLLQSLPLGW